MAEPTIPRLEKIERYLREHQYADLHTLARECAASLSTVRRALNHLESCGVVRRHHGGASLATENAEVGYDFIAQDSRQGAEKHAMAEYVADRIEAGMTVMLDGGTSVYALARLLAGKRIVVITNSLPIAALYNEVSSAETIVTGGTVYNRLGVLYGPVCEASLSEMHADVAVLSGAGLTEEGIWNANAMIAACQRRMLKAADRTFVVLDPSKFGKRALTLAMPLGPHFTVVSTSQPELRLARALRAAGTELALAAVSQSALRDRQPAPAKSAKKT